MATNGKSSEVKHSALAHIKTATPDVALLFSEFLYLKYYTCASKYNVIGY